MIGELLAGIQRPERVRLIEIDYDSVSFANLGRVRRLRRLQILGDVHWQQAAAAAYSRDAYQ